MNERITQGLLVALLLVGLAGLFGGVEKQKSSENLGTAFTVNPSSGLYTDGSDLRQNVQALSERMVGLSQGQLLQADSSGVMQAVNNVSVSGTLAARELTEAVTATNTLAVAESGSVFYLSGAPGPQTLPTSTTAGQVFRFVVGGALSASTTIVTSGAENVIEGSLLVAGSSVDCASEDTITFGGTVENVGDFVELRSDGTNWLIGASNALTALGIACSAT